MLLQRTDCLHEGALEIGADAHNFTGCLHLGGQSSLCGDELIERQSGHLDNTVVQSRFKARIGLAGNGILDFVQCIAQCDLCRNLGNGITGCLTCQCGRTAYTGIYFDDTVFKAGGMQGKLYVTAAGDAQLIDDVKCRATKHLVLFIA